MKWYDVLIWLVCILVIGGIAFCVIAPVWN